MPGDLPIRLSLFCFFAAVVFVIKKDMHLEQTRIEPVNDPLEERLSRNHAEVCARVRRAAERAGRDPGSIRLVAVTKTVGVEEIRVLANLGVTEFGENRLQPAQPKIEALRARGLTWHMLGPVQRRKARDVVTLFDYVDAVDRVAVAEALDKRCAELETRKAVLIEVNVSGEEQKHGFTPTALPEAIAAMRACERLDVQGLMTMAPFGAGELVLRKVFASLRDLCEAYGLPEISMGMSQDFEVAVEEGATQVRIGSALFQ